MSFLYSVFLHHFTAGGFQTVRTLHVHNSAIGPFLLQFHLPQPPSRVEHVGWWEWPAFPEDTTTKTAADATSIRRPWNPRYRRETTWRDTFLRIRVGILAIAAWATCEGSIRSDPPFYPIGKQVWVRRWLIEMA